MSIPPRTCPQEFIKDFTMDNQINIIDYWFDHSHASPVYWSKEMIDDYLRIYSIENINNETPEIKKTTPYPNIVKTLLKAFIENNIHNKEICVIGSETPWIEAILVNLNNTVDTIEYNVPLCDSDKITCLDYFEKFKKSNKQYDCIVSFSSIEHSGLGRYGDPINPNGDLDTMKDIYINLKDDGLLFLGVPIGHDTLCWNAHRIYGDLRLPILLKNFKEIKWYDYDKSVLLNMPCDGSFEQPLIQLKKR